jgi:hypothetical protein
MTIVQAFIKKLVYQKDMFIPLLFSAHLNNSIKYLVIAVS